MRFGAVESGRWPVRGVVPKPDCRDSGTYLASSPPGSSRPVLFETTAIVPSCPHSILTSYPYSTKFLLVKKQL